MKDANKKNLSKKYIDSAIVQKEIIARLMDRLSLINISPKEIIDVGAGVGLGSKEINKIYPEANCFMLDNSIESLNENILIEQNAYKVCANFKKIPFKNNSFDFIFSSSALHWDLDIESSFKEIYRILKPGGLFLFATYGPNTLIELRSAWSRVDEYKHVNDFYDMHNIGDLMQSINFDDSVVDFENIVVEYSDVFKLQKDLKNIGSKITYSKKNHQNLTAKNKMNAMYKEYEKFRQENGSIPATYEVIYGSAWKKFNSIKLID